MPTLTYVNGGSVMAGCSAQTACLPTGAWMTQAPNGLSYVAPAPIGGQNLVNGSVLGPWAGGMQQSPPPVGTLRSVPQLGFGTGLVPTAGAVPTAQVGSVPLARPASYVAPRSAPSQAGLGGERVFMQPGMPFPSASGSIVKACSMAQERALPVARELAAPPVPRQWIPKLGAEMPNFFCQTTLGDFHFWDFLDSDPQAPWTVLFSHPADFTPVCSTELGTCEMLMPQFLDRGVKLIGVSCDSLENHFGWMNDILYREGVEKPDGQVLAFPVIADSKKEIVTMLGMLDPEERDNAGLPLPARALMVIGPEKTLKLSILYPATTGRNFDEVLRVLDSLHLTGTTGLATPANWRAGDRVMIGPKISTEEAMQTFTNVVIEDLPTGKPYLRYCDCPQYGGLAQGQGTASAREVVTDAWMKVHEMLESPDLPVPRETFVQHCINTLPVSEERMPYYEEYANALFDVGTAFMFPERRDDVGQHAFGYAYLMAVEFYDDQPTDYLGLAREERAEDEYATLRADLDQDWDNVQRDQEGRVTNDVFVDYYLNKHSDKLVQETSEAYASFLVHVFRTCLCMMLPEQRETLGGHCFRYGGLLAGEFYFDNALQATTGTTRRIQVMDSLGIM